MRSGPIPSLFKSKRRRWEITEADLPTEKALAAEPRLCGLENNAIFRLAMLRKGGKFHQPGATGWIFLFFVMMVFLNLAGILLFFVILLIDGYCKRRSTTQPLFWGLSKEQLAELSLTSLRAEDYVIGLWGSQLAHRATRRRRWIIALLLILFASGYLWLHPVLQPLCPFALFVLAYFAGLTSFYPYEKVPKLSRKISAARWALVRAEDHGPSIELKDKILIGCAMPLIVIFGLLCATMSLAIMGLFIGALIVIVPKLFDSELYFFLRNPMVGLTAAAVGWFFGFAIGRICRRDADVEIKLATIGMRGILKMLREK